MSLTASNHVHVAILWSILLAKLQLVYRVDAIDRQSRSLFCWFTGLHAAFQFTPLPSARQHLSYDDCLEVNREYYQNWSVLDCVTQCSQSAAHLYEQFLRIQQTGFVTLGPLRFLRGGCLELCYCNVVEWFWWNSSLISTTNCPSVLWRCWFGHLACKNRPRNDLLCVEWDVKPFTLTHSLLDWMYPFAKSTGQWSLAVSGPLPSPTLPSALCDKSRSL